MNKKLLLTSAGFKKENKKDWNKGIVEGFKKLLEKNIKGLRCAFIPTAGYPEVDQWFIKAARSEIIALGMDFLEVDLKNPDKRFIRKMLEGSDVIYVNGGNTFYLLDWARKSGFSDYLKDLLNQEKVYVGVSAGSILVGSDIAISGWDPSWDKNVVNLKDTVGLKIVPFAISPHFTEAEREVLEKNIGSVNYSVVALTDDQAMVIDGKIQKIIGEGERIILHASN